MDKFSNELTLFVGRKSTRNSSNETLDES